MKRAKSIFLWGGEVSERRRGWLPTLIFRNVILGGEGGIRTHGNLAATTVFETVLFNRSSTSPRRIAFYRLQTFSVVSTI